MQYFNQETDDVIVSLNTSTSGLSAAEAQTRLLRHGANEITEAKRKGVLRVFFEQFMDLLVVILIASAVVSIFTGNADSAVVILCVIIMNAILGTVQHFNAEKSLASLKAMSAPNARVLRSGEVIEVPAREVTVGDILLLEAGNIASADGRILESASLCANESSLTGESEPVLKCSGVIPRGDNEIMLADRVNMLYTGSMITAGRGTAVVTAIGMDTEIGKIASLINKAQKKKTPLQISLDKFSKWLSIIVLAICAIVMGLSLLRGGGIMDSLMFAVALAVAAIPEALSSIVTISLAIGTQKMARENAIIKDLKAVEGLGCVSIICSDKTGTLTQNKMTVRGMYLNATTITHNMAEDISAEQLRLAMVLCNDAACNDLGCTIGDPTETALLECCAPNYCNDMRREYPRIAELPFDSDRKLMSTAHMLGGKATIITKGATDILLNKIVSIEKDGNVVPITPADIEAIRQANQSFSQSGMRVLCFAKRPLMQEKLLPEHECDYTFIGLCAMTDPPREESKAAVADCIRAGIKPIMITGDHKITAIAIAEQIGIFKDGDMALDGAELEEISDGELSLLLPKISVYARVSPAHKIRIVELWQSLGHIVAMTGDGVNDAPALKKADIGVAMGITGTEVSKDAASMVLTDDNFATIVKSVANGRSIYTNIKNSVKFLVSGNTAGILSVLYAFLLGLPSPFTAVHLLFINLLTDSLPAIAISTEKASEDALDQKPRKSTDNIMDKGMLSTIGIHGGIIAIVTMLAFHIGLAESPAVASTMAFATLCLARLFYGFNYRNARPISQIGLFSNKFSVLAFLAGLAFLAIALFVTPLHGFLDIAPLSAVQLLWVAVLAFIPTFIYQIYKMIKYRKAA